jgi:hypothetical protein
MKNELQKPTQRASASTPCASASAQWGGFLICLFQRSLRVVPGARANLLLSAHSLQAAAVGWFRARAAAGNLALCLAAACLTAGCGKSDQPPLGRVTGTVTLDGVPLPAALVVFTPEGPGRSAIATTDTAGRYQLAYLRDIEVANIGSHMVRITTATEERGSKEILPLRYHRKTELVALVEAGDNTIDFPLQSK